MTETPIDAPHPNQPRRTIVVADDDAILCDFIAMALTDLGYEARIAANGAEAVQLVEREQPALVLMDIGMPILSGRALAARIQEVTGRWVPCVLMSGDQPIPAEGDETTIAGYLSKPFDLDALFAMVRRCTAESVTTA